MASNSFVWGSAHVAGSGYLDVLSASGNSKANKGLFEKLPSAFKVLEQEAASPLVQGTKELKPIPYDEQVMQEILADAFTVDPNVKGERLVNLQLKISWNHMNIIRRRGLVLYFTGKLHLFKDIAMSIDAGFGYYAVDKISYAGNG